MEVYNNIGVIKMEKIEWDQEKSNDIRVDGNSIFLIDEKHGKNKYILSKSTLPAINCYVEIQKLCAGGCYDSIGVCTKR